MHPALAIPACCRTRCGTKSKRSPSKLSSVSLTRVGHARCTLCPCCCTTPIPHPALLPALSTSSTPGFEPMRALASSPLLGLSITTSPLSDSHYQQMPQLYPTRHHYQPPHHAHTARAALTKCARRYPLPLARSPLPHTSLLLPRLSQAQCRLGHPPLIRPGPPTPLRHRPRRS